METNNVTKYECPVVYICFKGHYGILNNDPVETADYNSVQPKVE
jgi:hypothetical protein